MKENKEHTPGSWFAAPDTTNNNGDYGIWTDDGPFNIATVHGSGNSQALANAAMIAAAPDLLAACEGMIDLCKTLLLKDCGFYSPDNNGYIQTARWAIAKAKGK
jgi:hypothetical protein